MLSASQLNRPGFAGAWVEVAKTHNLPLCYTKSFPAEPEIRGMQRHKVVLYNPLAVFFDMPLALLAIGSALDPATYEVVIVDARIEHNPHSKLLAACEGALCLGVTSLTGRPILDALAATRKVRGAFPKLPVVWGGWHTSLFPKETLVDEPAIDVTVRAQGEMTFRELVDAFANGSELSAVKGICFRSDDRIVQTPPRPMQNMNELPAANYNLIDVETYFSKKGKRQLDYISSTGCHFRCAFCADPFVYQRKFSAIEPERLGGELEEHYRKYTFGDVNFQDETFFNLPQAGNRHCQPVYR